MGHDAGLLARESNFERHVQLDSCTCSADCEACMMQFLRQMHPGVVKDIQYLPTLQAKVLGGVSQTPGHVQAWQDIRKLSRQVSRRNLGNAQSC